MTETFFVGNGYFPFNHYQLIQEHPSSYELMARIWGSEMKPPVADASARLSIAIKSQRRLQAASPEYVALESASPFHW